MQKQLIIGALAVSLTGCVTTQMAPFTRSNPAEPEVFMTGMPAQTYTEIGYIEASGGIFHTKKNLLAKLKTRAAKEKADALIQVRFNYVGWWPYAEGVAIKYQE